jgi:hypothetical protein
VADPFLPADQDVCAAWAEAAQVTALGCIPTGLTAELIAAKLPAATDLLYRASGYQWPGVCTSPIIRPRGVHPDDVAGGGPVAIQMGDGWWIPQGITGTLAVNCLGGGSCSCLSMRQILLPGEPVVSIEEVKIDGQVLDPEAYRVDNWRYLVRQDGGTWPCCQQAHLPDTEPGTWSVVFTYGAAPPASGVLAAVALATDLAAACATPDTCSLPPDAVRASRNGVEFDLQPADLMIDGKFTTPEAEAFIQATNPHGLADTGHVRSPELARHRSQQTPGA